MKQIIWTSDYLLDDKARKEYENSQRYLLDDDDYKVSDAEWTEVTNDNLTDERMNLDKQIEGVVIAFADLGLWNGRRQGYKILGHNINGIFNGFNIRGSLSHHDGTHYVLYRVAKDIDEAERIGEMIYNREIDEAGFRKKTRSLYPYVAEIYGWKTGRFRRAFQKAV